MHEIEVKILNINREEIEHKIIDLGATKSYDGEVSSLFMRQQNNSFDEDIKTIRLRKMQEKSFITLKKKIPHAVAKIRDEYEIEISNYDDAQKIFELLGFSNQVKVVKHRTSYILPNVRFEFDLHKEQYDHIPEYLEIEAKDTETLFKYVKMLGFTKNDCSSWTVKEIDENMKNEQAKTT